MEEPSQKPGGLDLQRMLLVGVAALSVTGGAGGMAALQASGGSHQAVLAASLAQDVRELREWKAATEQRLRGHEKLQEELRDGQKAIILRLDALVASAKGAR